MFSWTRVDFQPVYNEFSTFRAIERQVREAPAGKRSGPGIGSRSPLTTTDRLIPSRLLPLDAQGTCSGVCGLSFIIPDSSLIVNCLFGCLSFMIHHCAFMYLFLLCGVQGSARASLLVQGYLDHEKLPPPGTLQ